MRTGTMRPQYIYIYIYICGDVAGRGLRKGAAA